MQVCASWGRRFLLRAPEASTVLTIQARTRGKKMRPVTGDTVLARPLPNETDWLIETINPRNNELVRPDSRGNREVLAANIDLMVVVICAAPAVDLFMVDRFLAGARLMSCDAALVWNKADRNPAPDTLATYRDLGYPVLCTSAASTEGLNGLQQLLASRTSILVGQSGVGKSSLVNAMVGEAQQRTSQISSSNDEGRHTTVAAQLIDLPDSGSVIDSPGVRDYAPHIPSVHDVAYGFVEISETSQQCRFSDCLHRAEPHCAVKQAVEDGLIDSRRYQSFMRLAQLTRQLTQGRY